MPVGRRTAMGTGRGWSRGAGRGWTMLPGASRPSTTAAGPTTVAAGSGCPARWWRGRYTLPRWWPSWADRAPVCRSPYPSAAELAYTGGVEFFLEGFEVAEGLFDYFGYGAGGIASALGLHDVPEHAVVDVAAAVVADGAADIFGDGVQVAQEIFRSFLVQLGMLVQCRVEVLHVGGVMHVVMQMHRLFVDGGFERRVIVRQGGQFVRHFQFLQSLCHFRFPPKR